MALLSAVEHPRGRKELVGGHPLYRLPKSIIPDCTCALIKRNPGSQRQEEPLLAVCYGLVHDMRCLWQEQVGRAERGALPAYFQKECVLDVHYVLHTLFYYLLQCGVQALQTHTVPVTVCERFGRQHLLLSVAGAGRFR